MSAQVIDIRGRRTTVVVPLRHPTRGPTLVHPGITFEAWSESNAKHIWNTLARSGRRNTTFNEFARELWVST